VDVQIVSAFKERALLIPAYLAPVGSKQARVRVLGTFIGSEERVVHLGLRDDSNVEVLSGLEPGDRVLIRNGPR
ncbi:MAG TPA: efflux transporter periplasmic adaptor subunit, partial [Methylomirabilota bacterium]|nr:efflux transporter periplasmic adaptor subunit [Methylomirabilota bacterium]